MYLKVVILRSIVDTVENPRPKQTSARRGSIDTKKKRMLDAMSLDYLNVSKVNVNKKDHGPFEYRLPFWLHELGEMLLLMQQNPQFNGGSISDLCSHDWNMQHKF